VVPLNIEVLRPEQLEAADLAAWRRMQQATPALQNPFLTPEFTFAVAGAKPGVAVARLDDGDHPVGYFAFERGRVGAGRPIGAGLSDCQGVIHEPGLRWEPSELLRACRLSVIAFDHLVAGQAPFEAHVHRTESSPIIALSGGFESYVDRRQSESRSFRRLLARWTALRDDHAEVRFDYRRVDREILATLFEWKSAQYARTGRVDRFRRPWIRALVRDLMAVQSTTFSGVLASLWADDRLVAVQAGLATPTVLSLWFPAYNPEFAKYSPGNVLRLELARAAAAQGIEIVDMGKGFSVHKEHLKTGELSVSEARIERLSTRALIHRACSGPPRRLERFVLDHPRLRLAARRTLAQAGQVRVAARQVLHSR
jgi:CelD/BcsL family acetyltransferase involved in cellulose biosynthesis